MYLKRLAGPAARGYVKPQLWIKLDPLGRKRTEHGVHVGSAEPERGRDETVEVGVGAGAVPSCCQMLGPEIRKP